MVAITYDPRKRAATLAERGLDFEDAAEVFAGPTVEEEDTRWDYGERASSASGCCGVGWWSSCGRRAATRST